MWTNRELHQSAAQTEEQVQRFNHAHLYHPTPNVPAYFIFGGAAYQKEELPSDLLPKPSALSSSKDPNNSNY